MSEKRQPAIVINASIPGNGRSTKVELYPLTLWPNKFPNARPDRYRVRINGRFVYGIKKTGNGHTLSNVMAQLRSWIKTRKNMGPRK